MKKINLVLACGVVVIFASTTNVHAQNGKDLALNDSFGKSQIANFAVSENATASKIIINKSTGKERKAQLRKARVNTKVTDYVSNHFKDVSDFKIFGSTAENQLILARFTMHNKTVRIMYHKNGNWLYTIINCLEDDLPENVKSLINSDFKGYSITFVQEISQGQISFYKVYLENKTSFKQVLVYDGEVTVYSDLAKQ